MHTREVVENLGTALEFRRRKTLTLILNVKDVLRHQKEVCRFHKNCANSKCIVCPFKDLAKMMPKKRGSRSRFSFTVETKAITAHAQKVCVHHLGRKGSTCGRCPFKAGVIDALKQIGVISEKPI